jgi:integrase
VQRVDLEKPTGRCKTALAMTTPKSKGSRRTLQLPPFLVSELEAQMASQTTSRQLAGQRWIENDLVFPSSIGTPLEASNVRREWKVFLRLNGLPNMRIYDLRHSAGAFLAEMGVHRKEAMSILGHTQTSLWQRYREMAKSTGEGSKAMQRIFAGGSKTAGPTGADSTTYIRLLLSQRPPTYALEPLLHWMVAEGRISAE